jgi:hypothetical protein
MKLSIDIGRWTARKAALALAGLVAVGGAVGTALAISPTVPAPMKWQAGWETNIIHLNQSVGENAYTVPAGKNLLITDLVLGNRGGDTPAFFHLYRASSSQSCADPNSIPQAQFRFFFINIRTNENIIIPLTTGVGFASGQSVCIFRQGGGSVSVNMRGFLFTPG